MPPAVLVSLILGSIYGLLFFLLAGGARRGLWVYWLVGAASFLAGQFVAEYIQFSPITLGDVHVIEGSVFCWLALFVLYNRT